MMEKINKALPLIICLCLSSCSRHESDILSSIDPGSYDATWWNRTPIRLIQTNLPEIEGNMDRDEYLRSVMKASANCVLFNTGGIVANYQTRLPWQWKNQNIGTGDLVADLIKRFHDNGIRYIARFDFSKLDSTIAAQKPVRDIMLVRSGTRPRYKVDSQGWIECTVPEIRDFELILCLYR